MRIIACIISAVVTILLIIVLNVRWKTGGNETPRLGYFLSPQKGFWQNAENDKNFNLDLALKELQDNATVYFDERLVPHIYAENDHDAIFLQGYLQAKFRLWQMEFQTLAAGGRLSEIMGDSANGVNFLRVDQNFRRMGMVYGAENNLKQMSADPATKNALDAFTEGVNCYILNLEEKDLPLEYKLLDYKPELWSNLKSSLLQMYMSYNLAGYEQDFEQSNARSIFTRQQYEALYPYGHDSSKSIVPGAKFLTNHISPPASPVDLDSLYLNYKQAVQPLVPQQRPDRSHGSNNWAIDSTKTKSGYPILCNDPHLGLNLPAIWYEMQISSPNFNAYGVSLVGAPYIIIGFNESCAWGVTNAGRDVKDYYEIRFRDDSKQQYLYNGKWLNTSFRTEVIKIKGKASDTQRIAMTVWGPVIYEESFPDKLNSGKAYALRWSALDGSNGIKAFYELNRAKNYDDYVRATTTYACPGQNFVFASIKGDIAIRQQGDFPAKWRRQGDFIMPGTDSSFRWSGTIADSLNIILHNPPRGFVSSANQMVYDTSYPFYLGTGYPVYRGYIINRKLHQLQNATVEDMEKMQTDNYNVFAEMARPVLISLLDSNQNGTAREYLDVLKNWNLYNNAEEEGATVFKLFWDSLMTEVYQDEFSQTTLPLAWPDDASLFDNILKDSVKLFADDINTTTVETISDDVRMAFEKAVATCANLKKENKLKWGIYKGSGVRHLLRIPAFSRLNLFAGGGKGIINAYRDFHGPSWRMIVELGPEISARGIYPGGQSGNPGSRFYDNFIGDWVEGKYYTLHFYTRDQWEEKGTFIGRMSFKKIVTQ